MTSDRAIKPLPATQVPHASETIAAVVAALLERHYPDSVATFTEAELVATRRVTFTEHANGSVTAGITANASG